MEQSVTSKTKIKICGLSRIEDISVANQLLPDFIGFVFWDKSKRNVTKEQAADLKRYLDKNIRAVGVFVDADTDFIADLVSCGIIDVAQLHGSENEEYIKRLRDKIANTSNINTCRIIKAFNINLDFFVLNNLLIYIFILIYNILLDF